ncbi:hypothetical protein H310_11433 [Aphanomyces invadans]|uniref:Uncharacterized protein n=1 Tax=Aphanomyces invadans TaxID=157072 RepID=A0A024TLY5_9STRA|nr:hypothetical protein H310_11433 [Aphanomyces invadans]ETV95170.1 hypothetical protein H310_11433 [Aphanomyces invadans]|eukprot:XP_008876343.1 hypothetical protein H310_11433 [Aphanomyces invadans]
MLFDLAPAFSRAVAVNTSDVIAPSAFAPPLHGCPALAIATTDTAATSSYRLAMVKVATKCSVVEQARQVQGMRGVVGAVFFNSSANVDDATLPFVDTTVVLHLRGAFAKAYYDHVEIVLYASSTSPSLTPLLASIISAFEPSTVRFTPHVQVYPAKEWGCDSRPLQNNCPSLCVDDAFCTFDPDNDPDRENSGADMLLQHVRLWRQCVDFNRTILVLEHEAQLLFASGLTDFPALTVVDPLLYGVESGSTGYDSFRFSNTSRTLVRRAHMNRLPANDPHCNRLCMDGKGVPWGKAQVDPCGTCGGHGMRVGLGRNGWIRSFDACGLCADPCRQNFKCVVDNGSSEAVVQHVVHGLPCVPPTSNE